MALTKTWADAMTFPKAQVRLAKIFTAAQNPDMIAKLEKHELWWAQAKTDMEGIKKNTWFLGVKVTARHYLMILADGTYVDVAARLSNFDLYTD